MCNHKHVQSECATKNIAYYKHVCQQLAGACPLTLRKNVLMHVCRCKRNAKCKIKTEKRHYKNTRAVHLHPYWPPSYHFLALWPLPLPPLNLRFLPRRPPRPPPLELDSPFPTLASRCFSRARAAGCLGAVLRASVGLCLAKNLLALPAVSLSVLLRLCSWVQRRSACATTVHMRTAIPYKERWRSKSVSPAA